MKYNQKQIRKIRKQKESMLKWKNKEILYPYGFMGTRSVAQNPQVCGAGTGKTHCRCGFCGYRCRLDFANPCHTRVPPYPHIKANVPQVPCICHSLSHWFRLFFEFPAFSVC